MLGPGVGAGVCGEGVGLAVRCCVGLGAGVEWGGAVGLFVGFGLGVVGGRVGTTGLVGFGLGCVGFGVGAVGLGVGTGGLVGGAVGMGGLVGGFVGGFDGTGPLHEHSSSEVPQQSPGSSQYWQ